MHGIDLAHALYKASLVSAQITPFAFYFDGLEALSVMDRARMMMKPEDMAK